MLLKKIGIKCSGYHVLIFLFVYHKIKGKKMKITFLRWKR